MRAFLFSITFLFLFINAIAQKEDYTWMSGYSSNVGYDTALHHYFGINKLDFNYTPRRVSYDTTIGINFDRTVIDYNDTSGNINFYSNGIEIRNKWDEVIPGSTPMNNGYVINVFDPTIATMGYRYPQSDLALAIPNSNNEYLFFQCFMDSTTGQADLYVPSLLTTYLSMSGNANHGVVLYRDSLILKDTLSFHITACRHANGRDWWLLVRKLNSNCYYRILLTNQGAKVLPDMTCAGITSQFGGDGPCCFSPDGNKFAIINYLYGIVLYDFDRCTGTLSNPYSYPIPELLDSVWAINGLSFSPNSRFLYSAIEEYVFQFDTWQSNPLSNPDTIGRYDGFTDPFGVYYCEAQLAPDGKIYLAACNGASDYSVIDSPDMQGSACHFMPHSLHTTAYQNGQPITPNYRLGRLIGSACDTLTGLANIDLGSAIKLYPNPTQNLVTIDYGSVDWSSYNKLFLALKDMAGNQLYTSDLPRFSGIHRIEMSTFSSGLYLIEIQDDKGAILAIKKISKIE